MLPYILFPALIFAALLIVLYACARWIYVKTNWRPVEATVENTRIVVIPEGGSHLVVDVTYIFDDMLYRGSVELFSFDPNDYVAERPLAVLVNPRKPEQFNRDRNFVFQRTRIAKWLGEKVRCGQLLSVTKKEG